MNAATSAPPVSSALVTLEDSKSLKWQSAKTLIEKTLSSQDSVRAQTVLRKVFEHTREFGFSCTSAPDDAYFELRFSIRDNMKLREMTIMLYRMNVMPVTVCISRENPEIIIMSLPIAKSVSTDASVSSRSNDHGGANTAVSAASGAPVASAAATTAISENESAPPPSSSSSAGAHDDFPNKPNDVSDQLYVSEKDRVNIRNVQKHLLNIDFHQPSIDFGFSDFPDHYKIYANNLCFVKLEKLHRLLVEVPEITDVDFFCASGTYPAGIILSLRYADGNRKRSAEDGDDLSPYDHDHRDYGRDEKRSGGLGKRISGLFSFIPWGGGNKGENEAKRRK